MVYLGGSAIDVGYRVALDGSGFVYMSGHTTSTDFEGRLNSHHGGHNLDLFVARVDAECSLAWMTYLGGSACEEGYDLAVNGADESFVAAYTDSADFEGRNNAYQFADGAVVKVSAAGAVQWMSYVGQSGDDGCIAVALDDTGDAIIAEYSQSADFAGRLNDHRRVQDAFIGKVSAAGSLQWAMFAGGADSEDAAGIALDGAGHAFLSGSTLSLDLDGRTNESHGGRDAYLARVQIVDGPQLTVAAACPSGGPIRIEWFGATPGGQIALIYARNTGSFRVPPGNPCAGTQLGLRSNQIQLAWQGGAGANGSCVLSASTGPGACGGYMQLLNMPTCSTSNVAPVE